MALFAQGTLLKITAALGDVSGATTIFQVNDIKGPKVSQKLLDVTNQSSTEGWMEHIGGLLDGGTVTFDVNYEPLESTHKNSSGGLLYLLANRTIQSFALIFSDTAATTWHFNGLVTGFDVAAPVKGELKAAISIQITGKPTLV